MSVDKHRRKYFGNLHSGPLKNVAVYF